MIWHGQVVDHPCCVRTSSPWRCAVIPWGGRWIRTTRSSVLWCKAGTIHRQRRRVFARCSRVSRTAPASASPTHARVTARPSARCSQGKSITRVGLILTGARRRIGQRANASGTCQAARPLGTPNGSSRRMALSPTIAARDALCGLWRSTVKRGDTASRVGPRSRGPSVLHRGQARSVWGPWESLLALWGSHPHQRDKTVATLSRTTSMMTPAIPRELSPDVHKSIERILH